MKYSDLLGRAWEKMNCGEVVVEGLRRMGMEDAAEYVPVDQKSAARAMQGDGSVGAWFMVAEPDMRHYAEEGDLVVSDGPDADDVYHVALVLAGGQTLTSSKGHGVHCWPVMKTEGVRAIYRWKPLGTVLGWLG